MAPDGVEGEQRLADLQKEAYTLLKALMKIPASPNENYRNQMDHQIYNADTTAELEAYIRKIKQDTELMNRENERLQEASRRTKSMRDRLYDSEKSPERFGFNSNFWEAAIRQAKTPEDLYQIEEMMNRAERCFKHEFDSWYHYDGQELLREIEETLKKPSHSDKIIVYYTALPNLGTEFQKLSPSLQHVWVDYNTQQFAPPPPEPKKERKLTNLYGLFG